MEESHKRFLVNVLKFFGFIVASVIFLFYVLVRLFTTGPKIFSRKTHSIPQKLLEDYEHHYIQLSGARLHYVAKGSEKAPLMLFVHGFPEFWYAWRYQIDHFAKKYRVVAIDMRGYGQSQKLPFVEDYHIQLLADDIREVIEKLGYKSAVVVSHDWGAKVCWAAAALYPQVFAGLVIMNSPHPRAFSELLKTGVRQWFKSWYTITFQCPFIPEWMLLMNDMELLEKKFRDGSTAPQNFTEDYFEAWKATFGTFPDFNCPLNYYRASFKYQKDIDRLVGYIQPRTLIIWGEKDRYLENAGAKLSVKHCKDAQVRFLPNASHWVQQDRPNEVNAIIDEFLANK